MNAHVWIYAALSVLAFATLTFALAARLKRNDLADVIWGLLFVVSALSAWLFAAQDKNGDPRSMICFALTCAWAVRLSYHIGRRWFSHKSEDIRYRNMRKGWGKNWIVPSYTRVFVMQGLISLIINMPMLWILSQPAQEMDVFAYLGIAVWLTGFIFESVGDAQLKAFKAKPENKGKLMTTGLWSWSRHPNYFGEVVQWWGIFLFAAALPMGFVTILSPVAITFLILKVSGVPMLEKLMEGRPGSEEYRRRTSIFFPRPPKA